MLISRSIPSRGRDSQYSKNVLSQLLVYPYRDSDCEFWSKVSAETKKSCLERFRQFFFLSLLYKAYILSQQLRHSFQKSWSQFWLVIECRDLHAQNTYSRTEKDYHRCTRVENPEEGVAQIFSKIPGGQGFPDKVARGWVPYLGFYCIFTNKFFENLHGGTMV